MATYTVKKGDCLWTIASRYLGSGTRWTQLADLNGIPRNNPTIYVGQKINLSVGSTPAPGGGSSGGAQPAVQTRPTVEFLGLQAGTDRTLYAIFSWSRSNTKEYHLQWYYDVGHGTGQWFIGSEVSTDKTIVTYDAPSHAVGVLFKVCPVSETHKVNDKDVAYWSAQWSTDKTYYFSENPPTVPTNLTVDIENYKLTAEAQYNNTESAAQGIEFQVVKNNSTIYKTGKSGLSTNLARFSCTVDAGGEYKVRCRAYRGDKYSDWTDYSSNVKTEPAAPGGINVIRATSETSIYVEWSKSATAETYDLEYTTKKEYFDGSDKVSNKTGIEFNHYELTGLESGEEYFFRVRAVNDQGHSAWTAIKSIIIGKAPSAPTTWSSTTTATVGEPLNLYWVHNSEDGSSETFAEVELYIDGRKETHTVENTNEEDEKDKTKVFSIDTSEYKEGVKIQWRVRTAGITKKYGDWSIQRTVDIYAPPSLEFRIEDKNGDMIQTLTSFPFYVKAFAGPNTQEPIGYYVTISANQSYETTDNAGVNTTISQGGQVYSKYFDINKPLEIELSAGDINLENNIDYTIKCTVSMNSGLTTEETLVFNVAWEDEKFEPSAEIGIDKDTLSAYIRPFCDYYPFVYYKVNKVLKEVSDGGKNLFVVANSTPGFITFGTTEIMPPRDGRNEITSEYIPVTAGKNYTLQNWVTVSIDDESTESLWVAYQFYDSNKSLVESRVTKEIQYEDFGETTYGCWTFTIPSKASYIRISFRVYDDGRTKFEIGDMPTDYTPAPEDDMAPEVADYYSTDEEIEAFDGMSVDGVFTDRDEMIYRGVDTEGKTVYFSVRESKVGVPVEGVLLSVYRREYDGTLKELATGLDNNKNIYITDPHPSLDFARYRVVAISESTGSVSFNDVPGYPIEEKAIIIQWNEEWSQFETSSEDALQKPPWSGSLLKLPYNIDVTDSHSSDVSLIEYAGRKRPVSYYGTQLGETSSWKVDIERDDIDTLYALRRLAIWMGDVYVREPSGSGYWANVSVSFSQTHSELTIPVSLDIARVEGGI